MNISIEFIQGELYILKNNTLDKVKNDLEKIYNCDVSTLAFTHFWRIMPISETNVQLNLLCDEVNVECYGKNEWLDNLFIKLTDFLKEAKYVGRYFYRTEGIMDKKNNIVDLNYTKMLGCQALLLYQTEYLSIVLINGKYELIDSKYINDGYIEYYGEKEDYYQDRNEFIQSIYKQFKGKGRIR